DRAAAEQAVGIVQVVKALLRRVVPAVDDEPICLYQSGRSYELVWVPPVGRTLAAATGTQDALVGTVQLVTLRRRLEAFLFWRRLGIDEIGGDRVVLLEEVGHVDHQIANDRKARQRTQNDWLLHAANAGDASQAISTID